MKAGATDFLEKPFEVAELLAAVDRAFNLDANQIVQAARARLELLTGREHEVLNCLVAGNSNKEVAAALGLSPRTVEFHRAHILAKTGAKGIPELVWLWTEAMYPSPCRGRNCPR